MDDIISQLNDIKHTQDISRKRIMKRSKIDYYRTEITELHCANASLSEIVQWIRTYKRINISRMSVSRKIKQWMEEKNDA